MKVRNGDIAKIGTRAEQNTELRQYAQRLPLPYGKTTDEKIAQYCKELKKKKRHRQADKASGISSAKSNISKTMSSRKLEKPPTGASRSHKSSATPNTSAASSRAASPAASSIAIQTTSKGKRKRTAPEYYGFRELGMLCW